MTTVWVVHQGTYEQRGVVGIYDSPERAMAAHLGNWSRQVYAWRSMGVTRYREGWDAPDGELEMEPMDVVDAGPLAPPLATCTLVKAGGYVPHTIRAAEADELVGRA